MSTIVASPSKLSLACGQNKPEGFFGVDIADTEHTDMVMNLLPTPWEPWPLETNSVSEITCDHFVEHIPHHRPGWEKDGWWLFFDEVWRICEPGAVCTFTHPYTMSVRAFWDPTHERFIHETSWLYLNAQWRREQKLDHYPTDVDFEILTLDGVGLPDDFLTRSDPQQMFARNHYWNVVADLRVILKANK